MSDTIACSNCGATVPSAAAFCTTCGQSLANAAAAPPPPPPAPEPPASFAPEVPGADSTQVVTPGLHDSTQVQTPVPSAAPAPPSAPWGPPSETAAPAGPPTTAPWNPPAAPPPPTWQQPTAPPDAATFGPGTQPPVGGGWGAPGVAPPPGAWGGAPPAAAAPAGTKSIAGGAAAIVGAVLTAVGVFSGWVTLQLSADSGSETVTAWSLTGGEGLLKSNDPYLLLALAAMGAVVGILLFAGVARTLVRIAAIVVGLGIVVVCALNWMAIASFVQDNLPSSFEATTAIGFYLAIAGGVIIALASVLPAKK